MNASNWETGFGMIIHRTIAALLLSMAGPAAAAAQTVTGSVQSAGQPVVGATVRVLELDRVQRTDAQGRFGFANVPKGAYTLAVSSFGFAAKSARVEVAADVATARIDLRPSAVSLREVVVSASPTPRLSEDSYQSVDSKSQVDFDNGTGTSFAEKISDLPGVTVRGNGSAPSRPILRGLTDNEVLIVENGLRMGDIATFDPAHATPLEAMGIARVDVVRGPSAILYGPNTLGGLVNVITDIVPSVSNHQLSGTVNLEGNSVNSGYSGFARSVWSGENTAFSVSAGSLRSHDIGIPTGTYTDPASGADFHLRAMPQTDQHSSEAAVGLVQQGTFGEWGIGAKHFESNYGIPGVPPNADWIDVPPTTSRISQQRNTVEFRSLFRADIGVVERVKLDANYNDYTHSEFPTAQDSTGVSDPQANHFHKREFNATLQFQQRPSGSLDGAFGLWADLQDLTIEGDQPLGPNSRTTGLAAYAYEEFHAWPSTTVSAAARFDYNGIQTRPFLASTDSVFQTINASRTTNAFTASLGAVQKFTSELTGSVNVARSFRAPTVQELFAQGLDAASGTYSIGTSSLGPETGLGVDASLKGEFSTVAFEVSPYVNYINHFIYGFLRGDTIQDFPVRQFAATNARLMGFEASVTLQPWQRFAIRASSDYVNAQDTQNDVPLPFTPPVRGLIRGTYHDGDWMAMAEWRVAAAQNRLGDGDTPTSGYGILNLGYGMQYSVRGMVHNISLHVDNVFNRVYRDNLSVVKDFIPQPARGIRLNYEFTY
jgi:iron complex outermembrane receptor protein